jgi:hypothetical protein
MIILMIMNVTQEDVIEYCGTWYGFNCNGLPTMFVDPKHIHDGLDSEDDSFVDNHDEGVIDIGGIGHVDEFFPPTNDGGACVEPISLVAYLDKTLVHLHRTMQEIMDKCTLGGVTLLDHANSFLIVATLDI